MGDPRISLEDVIKKWGTPEQYYKEHEAFHKQHASADFIEYDCELKTPIRAVYLFRPRQVWVEHYKLLQRLAEATPPASDSGGE